MAGEILSGCGEIHHQCVVSSNVCLILQQYLLLDSAFSCAPLISFHESNVV